MEDKHLKDIDETIAYYDHNAEEFVNSTINADVSELYKPFEKLLSPGAKILDLGCGSGRDSRYFTQRGYDVVAVDPSPAMCEYTRSIVDIPVFQMRAEDMDFQNEFDAVWACASLLHVSRDRQNGALMLIEKALKPGGICYCSWKYGNGERLDGGRRYTDFTEEPLRVMFANFLSLEIIRIWMTNDIRQDRSQRWINVLIKK